MVNISFVKYFTIKDRNSTCSVPNKFLRQGVKREFQWVKFLLLTPNHYTLTVTIYLLGHAGFVTSQTSVREHIGSWPHMHMSEHR